MKDRKIIFECHVGSKLYGTSRPESDDDFMGVFLPSTEDLFSMHNCPSEWSMNEKVSDGERNTLGDIDRKYYSVQKFLNLLAQGQPKQLEMLFAPRDKTLIATVEWAKIQHNKDIFLSKNSVLPFIGFAKAQAYKATLKGDNLRLVQNLLKEFSCLRDHMFRRTVSEDIKLISETEGRFLGQLVKIEETQYRPGVMMKCMVVAGRKFEFTQSLKNVYNKLQELEAKYGTRSEAAAEAGFDYKSLMHSYRLLFETEHFLRTGKLEFPLPADQCQFLLNIRNGSYQSDYFQEIDDKLTEIKKIESPLPDEVNWSKVNKLCQEMLMEYHGK